MILILEAVFAAIAAVLTVLSLKTIGTIKHLGVGKSFWVPVLLSGILFLTASTVTILNEMNIVSIMGINEEIAQTSQLIALTVLVIGVFSYSKTISKSLATKITLPARAIRETEEAEEEAQPPRATQAPPPLQPREPLPTIQERLIQEDQRRETETVFHGCQHQVGYLQTLPRNVPIPDECMTCEKIIECKHSITKTQERSTTPPPENLTNQNDETPQEDEVPPSY